MAETSTIFGFMKYVSATDILSDFKKTVDSHFVNSLKWINDPFFFVFLEEYDIISNVNFCKKYEREHERLWNY